MTSIGFRSATNDDWPGIWKVFAEVVGAGDTYAYPPDIAEDEARALWLHDGEGRRVTFVALDGSEVVGTAYMKPNAGGPGDHIANAGWMIRPDQAGRGIGRTFAEYVMERAREASFLGMQFNGVVSTNERAVGLWESLGFEIVGTVPDAFRHPEAGLVPIHVMYRAL